MRKNFFCGSTTTVVFEELVAGHWEGDNVAGVPDDFRRGINLALAFKHTRDRGSPPFLSTSSDFQQVIKTV